MRVLFISNGSALQPILYYQGISHFKHLSRKGIKYTLLSFEKKQNDTSVEEASRTKDLEEELAHHGIDWIKIRMANRSVLPKWLRMNLWSLIYVLWITLTRKTQIIHIRSYQVALTGLVFRALCRIPFIFDMRGLLPEERVMCGLWSERGLGYRSAKMLERLLVRKANCVVVVSDPFAEYVRRIALHANIAVVPNCVDLADFAHDAQVRQRYRQMLSVDDKYVLIYSGSMQVWHSLPELLSLYVRLKRHITNAHFLFLAYERADEIHTAMQRQGIAPGDYSVLTVSPQDLPKYVQAADLAIMLMTENIVTRVCSPTKFAQYLASGVPVVINENIGDTETIIKTHHVGVVLSRANLHAGNTDSILRFIEGSDAVGLGERCTAAAATELSLERTESKYHKLYSSVLGFA